MKNSGFTLIELVVYIAIVVVVLISVIGFLWNTVLGNIKESSYQEVQQNSRFALFKISQEIKKSTGINSPLPGDSASALSLAMASSTNNPTLIDVVDGQLRITKGGSEPQVLTSGLVKVTSLQFTNFSYPNTPGTIRVEIKAKHINPANRSEYIASISLKTTVSLVQGGAAP